jgi:hypothetical protein
MTSAAHAHWTDSSAVVWPSAAPAPGDRNLELVYSTNIVADFNIKGTDPDPKQT